LNSIEILGSPGVQVVNWWRPLRTLDIRWGILELQSSHGDDSE